MKTVYFFFVTGVFLLASSSIQAQTQFQQRIGNAVQRSAENAATRQAERRTEQAVNKAIDEAFDANKNSGNTDNSKANQPVTNTPTNSPANAAGGSAAAPVANTADVVKTAELVYAKSDFVRGDVIFFEDEMVNEKMGEFPSQWDLNDGNAEIASINGVKCITLIGYTSIIPLMKEKNYLPEEFTIEFDIFTNLSDTKSSVECEIGFNSMEENRIFVPRTFISKDQINLYAHWVRPDGQGGSQNIEIPAKGGEWNHISISFNKRALKYYINGVRQLNIPNMKAPANFWIWQRGADGNGQFYIRNFRIAKGAVPLYDRMQSEGKFITYGITFDVGKSTIKPESMGEINRIVALLNENPTLKFSIEGHTDNTGNAASNQTLSEARSQAVVDKLVENGIARDRLKAAGKGQTAPIADNSTEEGKAKNRRVEFVKII